MDARADLLKALSMYPSGATAIVKQSLETIAKVALQNDDIGPDSKTYKDAVECLWQLQDKAYDKALNGC